MPEHPLHVLVEIPKGSRNKYEYDESLEAIRFDRFLFSSVVYPLDYGMIPETLAADGDPLDAMVTVSEPTFPGCVIPVKAIALFKMSDDKGIDDKVICVPLQDPNWNACETLEELQGQLLEELDVRDATVVVHDWGGPIGLRLAVEHPDRIARLVIMDTGLFTGRQPMSDAWKAFRDFVERTEDLPVGMLVRRACK